MRVGLVILLSVLVSVLGWTTGCTRRTLEITSEPSGALVHLNDREIGRTPVTVPFTFYGKYDVRLERDGYHPLWTTATAWPPPWDLPGPDLVFEAIPGTHARVRWHFELESAPAAADVDDAQLLENAQELRARLRGLDQSERTLQSR